jgi:hypothetical protein
MLSVSKTAERRAVLILLLGSFTSPRPSGAQTLVDSLKVGSRVRVHQTQDAPRKVTGVLLRIDSSSFTVRSDVEQVPYLIPSKAVSGLEVSLGKRTAGQGVMRGAGIGFVSGLGAGGLMIVGGMIQDSRNPCGDCYISVTMATAFLAVPTVALATLVGALVGAVSPGERWEAIELRKPHPDR